MLLDIFTNSAQFLDVFSFLISNEPYADLSKQERLREVGNHLRHIPFMGSYADLFQNGWSTRVFLKLLFDGFLLGALAWFVAWWLEVRHIKSLDKREAELKDIVVEARQGSIAPEKHSTPMFLIGSVVLSHDKFRSFTIMFTKIFGGSIKQYEVLYDRARREAILRLKEQAKTNGYMHVVNLKLVSTNITKGGLKAVEVVATGTGVKV